MSEKRDRQEIIDLAKTYCNKYLLKEDTFKEGDRINYGGRKFDEDIAICLRNALVKSWVLNMYRLSTLVLQPTYWHL